MNTKFQINFSPKRLKFEAFRPYLHYLQIGGAVAFKFVSLYITEKAQPSFKLFVMNLIQIMDNIINFLGLIFISNS